MKTIIAAVLLSLASISAARADYPRWCGNNGSAEICVAQLGSSNGSFTITEDGKTSTFGSKYSATHNATGRFSAPGYTYQHEGSGHGAYYDLKIKTAGDHSTAGTATLVIYESRWSFSPTSSQSFKMSQR